MLKQRRREVEELENGMRGIEKMEGEEGKEDAIRIMNEP